MEERDEALWDELDMIDSLACAPSSPQPSSPTSPPSSAWPWTQPSLSPTLQVRLDDGEPAEDAQPPPDLDLLLPSLPVASGRIGKTPTLPTRVPTADLLPSHVRKENISSNTPSALVKKEPRKVLLQKPSLSKPVPLSTAVKRVVAKEQGNTLSVSVSQSIPKPAISPVRTPAPVQRKPFAPRGPTQPVVESPVGSLKEKREREAKQFPKEVLGSLDGTTSAEVRKMSATERELVLFKRKLRNRQSARRSRQKRQATLAELQSEIDDIMQVTHRMVDIGVLLHSENAKLKQNLNMANAELKGMRSIYNEPRAPGAPTASASSVALKMKMGG